MAGPGREYEVISVSLPRDLVARINEIVPRTRRSRIIRELLVLLRRLRGPEAGRRGVQAVLRAPSRREAEEERSLLGGLGDQRRGSLGHCSSERRPVAVVRRGDVVLASLDPTVGVEIRKTRPVVVVSNDHINELSQLAVVVPLHEEHLPPVPQPCRDSPGTRRA